MTTKKNINPIVYSKVPMPREVHRELRTLAALDNTTIRTYILNAVLEKLAKDKENRVFSPQFWA